MQVYHLDLFPRAEARALSLAQKMRCLACAVRQPVILTKAT